MNQSSSLVTLKKEETPMQMIGIDLLGGDGKNGEIDAFARNMEAFKDFVAKEYAAIISSKVGFVLVGREDEIKDGLNGLDSEMMDHIQIYHEEKQAPMDGTGRERGNAISDLAQLQKKGKIVASFTNGSSKAALLQNKAALKKIDSNGRKLSPVITKEVLPGIFFADYGGIVETDAQGYFDMLQVLLEHSKSKNPKIMLLPDDDVSVEEIKDKIGRDQNYKRPDALSFAGIKGYGRPDHILINGFIGNICLKLSELLVKEKAGQNLSRDELRKIRERVIMLERGEKSEWIVPEEFNKKDTSFGILANGTEDNKGTKALRVLKKSIESEEDDFLGDIEPPALINKFRGFVEPSDLVNESDLFVLATPACVELINSFTAPSILQVKSDFWSQETLSNLWRIPNLLRLKKQAKETVSMAQIEPLNGKVYLGHGEALQKETEKIFKDLFEKMNQETQNQVGAVLSK